MRPCQRPSGNAWTSDVGPNELVWGVRTSSDQLGANDSYMTRTQRIYVNTTNRTRVGYVLGSVPIAFQLLSDSHPSGPN